jgi:hypothetical protein
MAISAKGRRRIQVDGVRYLWWVRSDLEDDFLGQPALTVASPDRQLLVRYGLGQPDESRHVVVLGPKFRGIAGLGGQWRRFRCPAFGTAALVTPRDVAACIRWCGAEEAATIEVDYLNRVVGSRE